MKGGRLIFVTGVGLFGFMLAALVLMSEILQDSERFGDYYSLLLGISAIGLLALVVLIGINLRNLIAQIRQRAPGIRLTVRMVAMTCVLAVTPVLILYYFSLSFLHRGIDNWFDLRVEEALDDSLELSRLALELRMKEILRQSKQAAEELAETTNAAIPFEIDEYRLRMGAEELMVLTRQGGFIASSVGDTSTLVPERPDEAILFQVQQGGSYIGLDTVGNLGLSIRSVVSVPQVGVEADPRILQALFTFSGRVNELAGSVESAFLKYQELSYLRDQLKFSFILVLTIVLLFSVFSAVSAAFYSARALASPIRDLAQGTQAVAAGDYSTQLPVPGRDELGFLVASFNEMTRRIGVARDAARQSQQHAEEQRAFLEAVLSRLSSGVLVIDGDGRVRTANISSSQILGATIPSLVDRSVSEITGLYPYL
ncbi:MAG TPA: HAMP domain-containing protein, partial [Gammaproteobacteria bacterium]